jgi:hypothetical protein
MGMKSPFSHTSPAVTAPSRFAGIRPLSHDPDERQSREDREYAQTIFTRRFTELPAFLVGRAKRS